MFFLLMITSLLQKLTEVSNLNRSCGSQFYYPSEDRIYYLVCVLFGHQFPEKASRVTTFHTHLCRHYPAAFSACKVHGEGDKER